MTRMAFLFTLSFAMATASFGEPQQRPELLEGCSWSEEWHSRLDELQKEDASLPVKIKDSVPKWPEGAFDHASRSSAVVEAVIDDKGLVVDARVIRGTGVPQADEAALKAIREWEFKPARLGDRAVPSCMSVVMTVHLK